MHRHNAGAPDGFYQIIVVDAFSSNAIPAHLLTKEAMQLYFRKLAPEGIVCIHTSNRFVNLPKVVAAVADELGFAHVTRGSDLPDEKVTNNPTHLGDMRPPSG